MLGVLQAEHDLRVRLEAFPNALNLRLIVDSQRLVSAHLAPLGGRTDPVIAEEWRDRSATYGQMQRELRDIGGRLGTGGLAATE